MSTFLDLDTKDILIIVLVLSLVGLVTYLLLRKKKHCYSKNCKPCPINTLQPWTGDQLTESFDIIKSLDPNSPPKDILQQLVSELSQKISFYDFFSAPPDYKYNLVYGVRGKWCDTIKKDFVQKLMKDNRMKGECILCIVGALEGGYSPKEVINFNENQYKQVMELMMKICQGPCHMTPS